MGMVILRFLFAEQLFLITIYLDGMLIMLKIWHKYSKIVLFLIKIFHHGTRYELCHVLCLMMGQQMLTGQILKNNCLGHVIRNNIFFSNWKRRIKILRHYAWEFFVIYLFLIILLLLIYEYLKGLFKSLIFTKRFV